MDREQIQSERMVERYLSGDLTMRAAREFEQYCREHPEVLAELPIPARIKSQLTSRAFDGMGTSVFTARKASDELTDIAAATGLKVVNANASDKDDDDEDERPSVGGVNRKVVNLLLVLLLVALAGVGYLLWQGHAQDRQIKRLSVTAKSLQLRAAGALNIIKIIPAPTPTDNPQASVSLNQAQWLDIHLNVSTSPYKTFLLTVEKTDEDVRIMEMRRLSIDTNKELRFALNSAALNAGDYQIRIDGIDYRGQPHPDGWALIRMQ